MHTVLDPRKLVSLPTFTLRHQALLKLGKGSDRPVAQYIGVGGWAVVGSISLSQLRDLVSPLCAESECKKRMDETNSSGRRLLSS